MEAFAQEIETLKNDKGIEYIEAVCLWCEKNNYELESVALLIRRDPVLKSKIKLEAETANMLKTKKGSTLPL